MIPEPVKPVVTIGIVNYNGMATLPAVTASILSQNASGIHMLLADNGSTDGSLEWFQANFPNNPCIRMGGNLGPAAARNAILAHSETRFILFLDNDIVLEPDAVGRMVRIISSHPEIALCHPEIQDESDPDVHHYNGGWIHYLGSFISRDKPGALEDRPEYEVFDTVSGAAMLVRRAVAVSAGGFDEAYFFNWEDGDFCIRLTLTGYSCVNVPLAVVHHRSKPRGTSKVFYQARNRWFFMLKLYSWKTLVFGLPMLAVFELGQMILVMAKGGIRDYLDGLAAVWENRRAILAKRRNFLPGKRIPDRVWLKSGAMYVPRQLTGSTKIARIQRMLFVIFDIWWRVLGTVI